jgi:hypothetical protein
MRIEVIIITYFVYTDIFIFYNLKNKYNNNSHKNV